MDENFFDVIDNEEKAYWLGFLSSDGCVSVTPQGGKSIIFGLHNMDEKHIYRFHESIGAPDKKVYSRLPRQAFSYTQIYSKKMVDDLIKHGCVPHKSLHLKFPTTLDDYHLRHYIRGYFDGDGSVYKSGGRVCCKWIGTYQFLSDLKIYMIMHGCSDRPVEHTYAGNIWHLRFQRRGDIFSIYKLLYNDSKFYLERKKKKFGLDIRV